MEIKIFLKKYLSFLVWPESPLERFLRSLYHRLLATKLIVSWQVRKATKSFEKWKIFQESQNPPDIDNFDNDPFISFIVPSDSFDLQAIKHTLDSLQNQRIQRWEVVIVSSDEINPQSWDAIQGENKGYRISLVTAQSLKPAIELSKGRFFVCLFPGESLSANFMNYISQAYGEFPNAIVYYTDAEIIQRSSKVTLPFFKPAGFSPELLLSVNYISSACIQKKAVLPLMEHLNTELDFTHQERELIFLLAERETNFHHIPRMLVQKIEPQCDDHTQTLNVISRYIARYGIHDAALDLQTKGRVILNSIQPLVSLIILSKNNHLILKALIDSVFAKTDYPDFEILIVDNASTDRDTLAYYAELSDRLKIRIIPFNEPFNYSKAENLGAANANGEILLFMNDDMQVLQPYWLSDLVQWALIPQIGIVSAKLLFPKGTIQHAGVVIGMQGFMGHLYLNAPDHYYGLLGSVDWYRNVSAVTGACQMIRKDLYEELGGHDENYELIFSDIDICLRVIEKGYRVLLNPYVTILHHQGYSRGYRSPIHDIARAYEILGPRLLSNDPYYSPNLTYTPIPECNPNPLSDVDRLDHINFRRQEIMAAVQKEQMQGKRN